MRARARLAMIRSAVAALVLTLIATSAFAAPDSLRADGGARESKQTATPRPERVFAELRKYVTEKAAKTAEVIKRNAANLRKRFDSEPKTAPGAKKAQPGKSAKAPEAPPAKPAE